MGVNKARCAGVAALGDCDKKPKYRVNKYPACGLHMAQLVKMELRFHLYMRVFVENWGVDDR